jgi:hypothetical protein
MSATTQHDFHPDAECLSAFAEQALGERERGQVLKHLAMCGRCRQVVALAHEAALEAAAQKADSDAKVAARARVRRAGIQPTAWWRQWRLVWVPTAVAAAFAVASISVYMRHVEQNAEMAKNERHAMTESTATPAALVQQEPAEAAPPAAPVAAKSPARSVKREFAGTAHNPSSQEIVVTAAMPAEPGASEHVERSREESAPASSAGEQGFTGEGSTPKQPMAAYTPEPAVTAWQQEQRHKAAAGATSSQSSHLYADRAPAPPASVNGTDGGAAESSTGQVTVSADQLETQSQPAARLAKQKQQPSVAIVADAMKAIHLPSGLPAVSMTAAGHRRLAIDQAGALFLSVDAGNHWEIVTQQWTGRAVAVRTEMKGNALAAPVAAAPGNSSNDTGAASSPATFFEILNDKNQVWLSTDGETWIAK